MPKISIITPVYCDTDEKINWLDETIQSVVNQTVTDWEMILINDKSPLSLDYIRSKYSGDIRLRWLKNANNEGPAKSRNSAVALAESDCILPLDSDDMLADNEVLEIMYDAWLTDKSKTVYGNVQLYKQNESGQFTRSKVYQLAQYSFEGAMNLEFGIMPVSTMHSKAAHHAAGGWKAALVHGREDLEYWIACGKAGYCGLKINHPTLLYRKHEQSRDYKLKFENKELRTVQYQIKDMHSDIYKGEFPMACCGKGSANAPSVNVDPIVLSGQNITATKITELSGYDDKDLEWVSYQGPKKGSFSVLVRSPSNLPASYLVLGTGHAFQIHKRQHEFFSQRQHMGFRVNQPDPRGVKAETPKPERVAPRVIEVPKPELSTLVSLDRVGSQTREAVIAIAPKSSDEVIVEPNADSDIMKPQMPADYLKQKQSYPLSGLGLSDRLTKTLDRSRWTLYDLANTTPQKLSSLPGIGIKRANTIIEKAKELINNQ